MLIFIIFIILLINIDYHLNNNINREDFTLKVSKNGDVKYKFDVLVTIYTNI